MSTQRADRIGEAIKRLVSELLQRRLKDSRITGMVSITDVEVSGDLRHAKVFVSIYGNEESQKLTMEGLKSASGMVRSEVGKSLGLRFAPEIQFRLDTSIERGAKIAAILQQIKGERTDTDHDSAVNE
ncbi:MAG: 30S ribosome-binding factor RbfA [Candidatus Sericytochromatia bacterium]|uniref:Ribosome-binding factor A n=1 Tax=Candidatus Tanganyikabacteria bacterium TaxID=2961651 RepID=A0A937X621_9BACT|nr:30S ribosome-binding factor RbfA [Candidatus Tanganyikabacteria bacterium]